MTAIINASIIMGVATIVESVGLTILRQGSNYAIPITSAIYALGVVPLINMGLQYKGIGMVNFLWNVFSTLIMFAVGIYMFKEKVNRLQIIGVLVSLLGLGLVYMAPDA